MKFLMYSFTNETQNLHVPSVFCLYFPKSHSHILKVINFTFWTLLALKLIKKLDFSCVNVRQ